ncbi:MAG: hormogonium polysaccharide biosynthesis protein HpsA [Cyanobacteria bacterium J06560_6]
MSAKKQTRNRTPHKPHSTFQRLARRFMSSALRSLFLLNSSSRQYGRAGFVLPTTVLLLLVMTLTVGALSFRTASRTQVTSLSREQQVIDNISAPAIDRAKAKLEYLFTSDVRMPGTGTPSSDLLAVLMRNVTEPSLGVTAFPSGDPYTIAPDQPDGETRLDLNGDDVLDNAWSFNYDLDGNGTIEPGETIAYSLLMDDAIDPANAVGGTGTATPTRDDDIKLEDSDDTRKATNLVTRNGPINTDETLAACGGSREPEQGWLAVNEATLEKNFQITAFATNGSEVNKANSAIELQQVRRALKGNRWGAWFKYDMDLFPGPVFNWNGAIHSESNIMLSGKLRAHMVSSHNSCLYDRDSSRLTMAEHQNDNDSTDVNLTAADPNDRDFQGQLIFGTPFWGDFGQVVWWDNSAYVDIHLFTNDNQAPNINDTNATRLTEANDSVTNRDSRTLGSPIEIAVDPVRLFSEDTFYHLSTDNWQRDPDWEDEPYNAQGQGRVLNQQVRAPYLDDFSRADNRYGPRPTYDTLDWVADSDKALGDPILTTDAQADSLRNETSGLDGYWEKQSIINGMRTVVGQRLELGDVNGWNFDPVTNEAVSTDYPTTPNAESLYPPESLGADDNKQKQRVTLRDNLAAVQGMVVYHYETNGGTYPLACVANTAHPGTWQSLVDSRTFNTVDGFVNTDFLNGVGTNGWEFSFPDTLDTEDKFAAQIASTLPLGRALRNLSYFAGDPNGGSPSFRPEQDAFVHPFPHQAMWGDFSILRRIFAEYLDDGVSYNSLSFADKSSLHSAACTLGMLAYNVEKAQGDVQSNAIFASMNNGDWTSLATKILQLSDQNTNNGSPTIGRPGDGTNLCKTTNNPPGDCPAVNPFDITDPLSPLHSTNYYSQFSPEEWINALKNLNSNALDSTEEQALRLLISGNQILRDRTLGFATEGAFGGSPSGDLDLSTGKWNNPTSGSNRASGGGVTPGTVQYRLGCDPQTFEDATAGATSNSGRARLGLAMVACSYSTPPKYPSLYYLFPRENHSHLGTGNHAQPTTEEYINEVAAYGVNDTVPVNTTLPYRLLKNDTDDGIGDIAFTPAAADLSDWSTTNPTGWKLPRGTPRTGTLDPETFDIAIPSGQLVNLSMLEKVMYNGREEMAVRVLDIDLGLLTQTTNDADFWISDNKQSQSGVFYGAREDALREDSIVRPAASTWANCNSLAELTSNTCFMNTGDANPADPPLSRRRSDNSFVGISLKPVDFAPDPDRRPHGFRLNADLDGNFGDLSNRFNREWGFTLVTDNAAYIKGEFNPHSTNGKDTIEEFTDTLLDGDPDLVYEGAFYNDRLDTNLNLDEFATDTADRWRPAEILADAVSILSSKFVDGSVEEGFIRSETEASTEFTDRNVTNRADTNFPSSPAITSFHNQQRPLFDTGRFGPAGIWLRSNGTYPVDDGWVRDGSTGGPTYRTPVWVGRNGESRTRADNGGSGSITFFRDFTDAEGNSAPSRTTASFNGQVLSGNNFRLPNERSGRNMMINVPPGLDPRVNATIISGLGPSRDEQAYGGLHNFPRFLEGWENVAGNTKTPLYIQGAFLQLNFSTASTGPFDADAWDPGETGNGNSDIYYYDPPDRQWGYDAALQYTPAGPIAQRFVTLERPRSEHYRELPIDDPYVTNLRCARKETAPDTWERTFSSETCP